MINTVHNLSVTRPWMHHYFVPMNVVLAVLASVLSLFVTPSIIVQGTAYIGGVWLILTLLPSNLLHLERFKRGGAVRTTAQFRAPLGISAGVWFMAHTVVSLHLFDLAAPLLPQFFAADIVTGTFALVIFVALLLTSNTASQRRMGKNWKRLQRLVWFTLPLAITHALLSSGRFFGDPKGFGAFLLAISAGLVIYEGFFLWRSSAGNRKMLAHVRLLAAGVAAAALLYVIVPTKPNPLEASVQNSTIQTSTVRATTTRATTTLE